jgi:hypothetical protein
VAFEGADIVGLREVVGLLLNMLKSFFFSFAPSDRRFDLEKPESILAGVVDIGEIMQ